MGLGARYYRQILYGCTNPRCETPSCLSRQKRVTKGPFRPYTVLSARALATHLASQDHPDSGLCPHEQLNMGTSMGPLASFDHNEIKKKKPTQAKDPKATRSQQQRNPYRTLEPSHRRLSFTVDKSDIHVANGQAKLSATNTSNAEICVEPKPTKTEKHGKPVKRDLKSFTQALFNTAAMKMLQLSSYPAEYLRYLRPDTVEGHQQDHPAHENNDDGDGRMEITTHDKSLARFRCPGQEHCSPDVDHKQGAEAAIQLDDSSRLETAALKAHFYQKIPSNAFPQDERPEHLPYHRSEVGLNRSARSLSRFSSLNISALEWKMDCYKDLLKGHRYRQYMGRTDSSLLHAPDMQSPQAKQYHDLTIFINQSITYILSNTKALFESFIDVDPTHDKPQCITTYGLSRMVALFRRLRKIDPTSHSILPSLWVSVGEVYVPGLARSSSSNRAVLLEKESIPEGLPSGGVNRSQAHSRMLETCHIAKIVLAALLATIPPCQATQYHAIRLCKSSGLTMPLAVHSSSPRDNDVTNEVLDIVLAFEDEMALNVIKRLLKALASHHYAFKPYENYEKQPDGSEIYDGRRGVFASIVFYVTNEKSTILVSPSSARPTLEKGQLKRDSELDEGLGLTLMFLVEWLRTVILSEWDGRPTVLKFSAMSGALEFLLELCIYPLSP